MDKVSRVLEMYIIYHIQWCSQDFKIEGGGKTKYFLKNTQLLKIIIYYLNFGQSNNKRLRWHLRKNLELLLCEFFFVYFYHNFPSFKFLFFNRAIFISFQNFTIFSNRLMTNGRNHIPLPLPHGYVTDHKCILS